MALFDSRTPVRQLRPLRECTSARRTSTLGMSPSNTSVSPSVVTTEVSAGVPRWEGLEITFLTCWGKDCLGHLPSKSCNDYILGHLWITHENNHITWSEQLYMVKSKKSAVKVLNAKTVLWCSCLPGQEVRLDTGSLAQEKRRVPSAHAQERREQRWAQGIHFHILPEFIHWMFTWSGFSVSSISQFTALEL